MSVAEAPTTKQQTSDEPNTDPSAQTPEEPLFTSSELREFSESDEEAGRRIGKILATLFIYTVIAMSIVIWWTMRVVGE